MSKLEDLQRAQVIQLGIDANKFEESAFGQYLLNRAAQEAHNALMKFKTVDPGDIDAIRKLQFEIKRYEDFERWLSEAIREGKAEYEQYIEEQNRSE